MAWNFKLLPKEMQKNIKMYAIEPTPSAKATKAFNFSIEYHHCETMTTIDLQPNVSGANFYRNRVRVYLRERAAWRRPHKVWMTPSDLLRTWCFISARD